MLRYKLLWDSWMAQPACEAALAHHRARTDDRLVPITLAGCGDLALGGTAAGNGLRMTRSERRLS